MIQPELSLLPSFQLPVEVMQCYGFTHLATVGFVGGFSSFLWLVLFWLLLASAISTFLCLKPPLVFLSQGTRQDSLCICYPTNKASLHWHHWCSTAITFCLQEKSLLKPKTPKSSLPTHQPFSPILAPCDTVHMVRSITQWDTFSCEKWWDSYFIYENVACFGVSETIQF